MVAPRSAMVAVNHIPKKFWAHAVLVTADKRNYLATAKMCKLQKIPNTNIA